MRKILLLLSALFIAVEVNTASAAIVTSIEPSRTTGVAPLSVFFDATGTAGLTDTGFFSNNAAYMDATFAWDFDADNFDPNGKYKKASGFVAAHVFEKPGTYRVHLDVYDAAGNTASKDITITVSGFSGTTYYVATAPLGNDSNDGLSMDHPFLTVNHALTGSHVQNNTRILFRRGDTFNTAYVAVSSAASPVIVDSYEDPSYPSTAKPIIYSTEADGAYAAIDLTVNDWRVMNIAVRSGGHTFGSPRYPTGINLGSGTTNNLKYRTTEYEFGQVAMNIGGSYNTIAECEFYNSNLGAYSSDGDGVAVIGNHVHDQTGDVVGVHTFRFQGGSRLFYANNTIGPNIAAVQWDGLTIRGNAEKVVVFKNRFEGHVQAIRPQNTNSAPEYQHNVIFDSNSFLGMNLYPGDRQSALQIDAKDIVFRNNIIYNFEFLFSIQKDSVVGNSQRIKIYNNTFINATSNSYYYIFSVDHPCSNIEIKNNLMLDMAGSDPIHTFFLDIADGSTFNGESDYNMFYGSSWGANPVLFDGSTLTNWRSATGNDINSSIANPNLASTDYANANFCKPQAGSPVINAGAFTPAALDYNGNLRGSSIDIGACEYEASCPNKAVHINGTSNYYDTVSAAYTAASTGQSILMQEKSFTENLSLTDNIIVTLKGGYNCNYSSSSGFSTIAGRVTIGGSGKVTMDKLIIK
jgi:hypothetical protein